MGALKVTSFLTSLAVDGHVAASTQNQALSALLFLYRDVLEVDLPWLDGVVRAKRSARLPVVLTRDEVRAVLQRLEGAPDSWPACFTGRVCGCLSAAGSVSKTLTSPQPDRRPRWQGRQGPGDHAPGHGEARSPLAPRG